MSQHVRLAHGAKEACHHAVKQKNLEPPKSIIWTYFRWPKFCFLSEHGNPVWPLILAWRECVRFGLYSPFRISPVIPGNTNPSKASYCQRKSKPFFANARLFPGHSRLFSGYSRPTGYDRNFQKRFEQQRWKMPSDPEMVGLQSLGGMGQVTGNIQRPYPWNEMPSAAPASPSPLCNSTSPRSL